MFFRFTNQNKAICFVDLTCHDVCFQTDGSAELYPNHYCSSSKYVVTGDDARRLQRIMEENQMRTEAEERKDS